MIGNLEINLAPFFVVLAVMIAMVAIGLSGPKDRDDGKKRRRPFE